MKGKQQRQPLPHRTTNKALLGTLAEGILLQQRAPISHVPGGSIVQDADGEGVDGARARCQPGREPARALDLSHDLAAADLRRLEQRECEAQPLPHDAGRSSSIPPCATHQGHCLDPAAVDEPVGQKMWLPSQQTGGYTPAQCGPQQQCQNTTGAAQSHE